MSRSQTYKKIAFDYIRNALMNGVIQQGDRVIADDIAVALGISIAPVREAIMELASRGLLEYRPNAGAVARTVSADELAGYDELRSHVEPLAAAKACRNGTPKQLKNIDRCFREMEKICTRIEAQQDNSEALERLLWSFNAADMNFHLAIFDAANHHALQRFGQQFADCFYLHTATIKHRLHDLPSLLAKQRNDLMIHRRINDAVQSRDAEKASKWMHKSLSPE